MHNTAALDDIIGCDSDFRIARDGTWYHQGSPIGRQAMVRLFSTILCRDEAGEYWLKTPVEKCRITVEDAPFMAIASRWRDLEHGVTLCLKTNVNEWVPVDAAHPLTLRADTESGELLPYLLVRDRLEAKLNRTVYYELVEHALAGAIRQDGRLGIVSAGQFFPLEGASS